MHHTLKRRVAMTATLAFGLIVGVGAAVRPLPTAPVAAAQTINVLQVADDEPAEDEPADGQPAVEGTPTPGSPPPPPPAPSPVPSPAAGAATGTATSTVPVPPAIVAGVKADNLKGDAVFRSGICPTNDASGINTDEGFRLLVRGRCGPNQNVASIAVSGQEIAFKDGDIALDFRVASGAGRAGITLYARSRDGKLLATYLNFQSGEASLYRRESGTNTTLTTANDLAELATPTDWNRLALRVRAGEAWVLLNDQPMLYVPDALVQEGGVGIGITREGNVDDEDVVSVVFRDLSVSTVEPAE